MNIDGHAEQNSHGSGTVTGQVTPTILVLVPCD
jgi:hypothetical protein